MSLFSTSIFLCDACGAVIEGTPQTKAGEVLTTYTSLVRRAEREGWTFVDKGSKPREHYCPKCKEPSIREIRRAHRNLL